MSNHLADATVLLVEDTLSLARTYMAYLKDESFDVIHVETGAQALAALEPRPPNAVLLDLVLPDMDGLEILRSISEQKIPSAVIVITAHGSVQVAVEAMRLGAFDFLIKPFNADRLTITVRNALERQHLSKIVETFKDVDRQEYCGFIGSSLPMQAVYRIIDSTASSKATVFITGESGTGKEICAEAIHSQGPRANRPFVAVNCGAIPRDLMESEMFGHVKGAFTGAIVDRDGAARRSDGGTLFLDEICEMDMSLQTKLLRFIQTGTFQKVGGNRLEETDIRFVCATNRDPFAEVAAGRFREDLFYRLHVIPIRLPPLHARDHDVISIANKFLRDFAEEEGKSFTRFSSETQSTLRAYSWPGNIRQLQNVIRNMVVLHEGDTVTPEMLPSPLDRQTVEAVAPPPSATVHSAPAPSAPMNFAPAPATPPPPRDAMAASPIRPLAEMEREIIERAIGQCQGNIPQAAAQLEISPSTIYRKRAAWQDAADNPEPL